MQQSQELNQMVEYAFLEYTVGEERRVEAFTYPPDANKDRQMQVFITFLYNHEDATSIREVGVQEWLAYQVQRNSDIRMN